MIYHRDLAKLDRETCIHVHPTSVFLVANQELPVDGVRCNSSAVWTCFAPLGRIINPAAVARRWARPTRKKQRMTMLPGKNI